MKVASDKCSVKKVLMVVDVFWYWSESHVKEVQLTKWAVLSLRIISGIFFWWKTILTELKILNCQVLYLGFTEAITQNCSSFIWKGLGLRDRQVLQNTYLWYNITIPPSLSQLAKKNTLHKKWSFPWRTSSVNMTKSAVSSGFGHI